MHSQLINKDDLYATHTQRDRLLEIYLNKFLVKDAAPLLLTKNSKKLRLGSLPNHPLIIKALDLEPNYSIKRAYSEHSLLTGNDASSSRMFNSELSHYIRTYYDE